MGFGIAQTDPIPGTGPPMGKIVAAVAAVTL